MATYIGPSCRLCRRSGDKLMLKGGRCYSPKCGVDKRPKPPGQASTQRRRISDRGTQLREKQKARYSYGIMETQFKRMFREAERQPGVSGDNLMVLLERRLDNVVYRLGFADSRSQARQLVQHGHIKVNEHATNIPSFLVREGDTITWVETSAKSVYYKDLAQTIASKVVPNWLSLDRQILIGKVVSVPTPEDAESKFDAKSIVEYYSR
ncbi:MAG: 30S ribosomal protein S4 [Chloroflexi bacterium]|nr:30S ribosomal protein S4 [Chloroflexota bacterium]